MLSRVLGDSNRALSKVVEKIRIAPAGVDEYLFLNSPILKNLISSTNGSEVNDVRGIYTCLNIVQLSHLYYKYYLLGQAERVQVDFSLTSLLEEYSREHIPKEGLYLSSGYLIEESYFPSSWRAV